jgi:tetratricopeptide (TPR) repeat protein
MKNSFRIRFACACFCSVWLTVSTAAVQESGFLASPPKAGKISVFSIDPADAAVIFNARSVLLNLYTNLLNPPDTIPMKILDGTWKASYALRDTSVKAFFYDFTVESFSGRKDRLGPGKSLWEAMVVDDSGRPVFGAHQAVALSYSGSNTLRPENLDRVAAELREELRLFPDNYSARTLLYSVWLKKTGFSAETKRKIGLEVDSLITTPAEREPVMNFAIGAYRMLGENDKAQVLEKSLIAQNPGGERSAMKRFSEIINLQDAAQRLQELDRFLADFPRSRMTEPALAQAAASAIELNDTTAMIRTGDTLLRSAVSPAGANGLAGIAGVFADKRFDLDRATAYIGKALDLVRSVYSAAGPDPDREEERRNTEAQYRDVLGWVLLQKNQVSEALNELQEASKNRLQVKTFVHMAEALARAGRREDALTWYGRAAAFSGPTGDAAYATFKDLWKQTGRDTVLSAAFLSEQTQWVEKSSREKILEKKSVSPAPDFRLQDVRGGWVRLGDQKGNVVLLCFWGTWSKSSQVLLKSLEELTDKYGQSVLFLTVAMDQDPDAVKQFVRKERLILPVLLNDEQEKNFHLEGVPMIFLVDRNGNIRFSHKGYRKDINSILSVEMEDLLGATSL